MVVPLLLLSFQDALHHASRACSVTPSPESDSSVQLSEPWSVSITLAELFFAVLKSECDNRIVYSTRERARRGITRYIEHWYSHRRFHSELG